MKSKISIWDCRRAIDIAGGLPLAIRGDLFTGPGPHPVGRWFPETAVLVTQLEVKQGRWVIGNIGFTRHGQEHLSKTNQDGETNDVRFVKDGVLRGIRTLLAATSPEPGDRVVPLSAQMIGLASELTSSGASTTDVMLVAHYAAGATAERGAVARYL